MRRLYVLIASAVIATFLIALTMSTVSAQESKRYGAIAAVPSLVRGVDGYGATPKQAKSAAIEECRQFASHWRKYAGDARAPSGCATAG